MKKQELIRDKIFSKLRTTGAQPVESYTVRLKYTKKKHHTAWFYQYLAVVIIS